MTTKTGPEPYEVWRIPFAFEEDPAKTKERPVIVIDVNEGTALVLVAKVTGHGPRPEFPGEVRLVDWTRAGLSKPSTVRCSKRLFYPLEGFDGATYYGKLSPADAAAVRAALTPLL